MDRPLYGFRNPMRYRAATVFNHRNMADRTRKIWLPITGASVAVGTPTLGIQGTNKLYQAWSFANGAVGTIACAIQIPVDVVEEIGTTTAISNATWRLYWTNLGAGSGNVVWQIDIAAQKDSGNLNATLSAGGAQTIAAPSQDTMKVSTWVVSPFWPASVSSYDVLQIRIARTGTSGSDTLGNAAGLVGLGLSYTADM